MGYIYIIHLPDGLKYIGQTIHRRLNKTTYKRFEVSLAQRERSIHCDAKVWDQYNQI